MMRIMSSSSCLLMVLFCLTSLISTTLLGGGVVAQGQFRCGKDFGGALCPNGHCCSKWGHCGNTSSYCHLESCQSQCYTVSPLSDKVDVQAVGEFQCGEGAGGALCPNNQCCSRWGYCGTTWDYCGTGCQSQCHTVSPLSDKFDVQAVGEFQCGEGAGDAVCPNNQCCSYWGYCGENWEFCSTGCQSQCWDDSTARANGGDHDGILIELPLGTA